MIDKNPAVIYRSQKRLFSVSRAFRVPKVL
jgi:hypothetical protein